MNKSVMKKMIIVCAMLMSVSVFAMDKSDGGRETGNGEGNLTCTTGAGDEITITSQDLDGLATSLGKTRDEITVRDIEIAFQCTLF